MKTILVLVNKTYRNKSSFCSEISRKLPADVKLKVAHFEDIIIDIELNKITIFVDGEDIGNYDLVYFRRSGKKFLWLAGSIAVYLNSIGKHYIDSTYKEVGPFGTKLTSFIKLALAGLPMIPSYFCYREHILGNSDQIIEKLGLPLVAKELYSQRGIGVSLIKNKQDFEKLLEENPDKKFMFQKFVDKKEEFRVLVLGEKIGAFERKTSTDPNEFRNNVCLGAKEDFIDISEMSEDMKYISIKSAKVLNIEIAGVDVIVDREDKPWILEVNRGPGFTYNSDKSPEIENVTEYLTQEVRRND